MFRKIFLMIFFCAVLEPVLALDLSVGLNGFADNREYHSAFRNSQTFFGVRGTALGSQTIGRFASVNAGLSWMMEFGSDTLRLPAPILYFGYSDSSTFFRMGAFPRSESIDIPECLLADSFKIFRPNIQGAVFKRFNGGITRTVWIDWIGRQADSVRESFLFGTQLGGNIGRVKLSSDMLYIHTARAKDADSLQHVTDDGGMRGTVAVPFSPQFFDSLVPSFTALVTWHRVRDDVESWYTPLGAEASLLVMKKIFGLRVSYFRNLWADPDFVSTQKGGLATDRKFQYNDGIYWSSEFESNDIFVVISHKQWLNVRFDVFINVVDHEVDNREKFSLTASFGHHIKRPHRT